jgi:aryl-alcohol dehydrogenase-like predicted oxidoreductase
MHYRRLGKQGPMVSAVGLGAMSFASVYGSAEDAESAATIARALELGVTFIDTANIYGAGHSEEVVGQTEYSMFSREPEEAIIPTTRELGIGFVSYSPLGRGMLTGQFQRLDDLPADDWRRSVPRWQEDNFDHNVRLVSRLEEIARRHTITTAQLALAWVLRQGEDIVPIPGTRKPENLAAKAAGADVTLSAEDLEEIDAVASPDRVGGARGAEAYMARVNV